MEAQYRVVGDFVFLEEPSVILKCKDKKIVCKRKIFDYFMGFSKRYDEKTNEIDVSEESFMDVICIAFPTKHIFENLHQRSPEYIRKLTMYMIKWDFDFNRIVEDEAIWIEFKYYKHFYLDTEEAKYIFRKKIKTDLLSVLSPEDLKFVEENSPNFSFRDNEYTIVKEDPYVSVRCSNGKIAISRKFIYSCICLQSTIDIARGEEIDMSFFTCESIIKFCEKVEKDGCWSYPNNYNDFTMTLYVTQKLDKKKCIYMSDYIINNIVVKNVLGYYILALDTNCKEVVEYWKEKILDCANGIIYSMFSSRYFINDVNERIRKINLMKKIYFENDSLNPSIQREIGEVFLQASRRYKICDRNVCKEILKYFPPVEITFLETKVNYGIYGTHTSRYFNFECVVGGTRGKKYLFSFKVGELDSLPIFVLSEKGKILYEGNGEKEETGEKERTARDIYLFLRSEIRKLYF